MASQGQIYTKDSGRKRRSFSRFLIGDPLETASSPHQALDKFVALAVLASDALSSVGYATQEMLVILVLAASTVGQDKAFGFSLPLSGVILVLLAILTTSYRQTIFAYPDGGGSYRVSKENLGELPAQIAGAALSLDYILTVAVSVSSGVAQITSALPVLHDYRVIIAIVFIVFMTIMNLRGVKESGILFAIPTYFFILATVITIVVGAVRYFTGTLGEVTDAEMIHVLPGHAQGITLFLILRAFSSGCTALTGVEAISNGVGAFQDPKSKNAATTMLMMTTLIFFLFGGITLLAHVTKAVPSETETLISQITRTIYGNRGIFYSIQMAGMTAILLMAANTSYADFPRLAALHATDGFLPRRLAIKGSRLVFSWGVLVLAVVTSLLIIVFKAETTLLIPLYAIGVFLSFAMSDTGMVVHWWRTRKLKPGETEKLEFTTLHYDSGWRWKMVVNAVGAVASFVVMCVFAVTKFMQGAWIIIILIPTLVAIFFRIHHHYQTVAKKLSLAGQGKEIGARPIRTVILIDSLHASAIRVINFAISLNIPWEAIHISLDEERTKKAVAKWKEAFPDRELIILESPYRSLADPLRQYISDIREQQPDAYIHLMLGNLSLETFWEQALHMNSSDVIRNALRDIEGVGITNVSFQLSDAQLAEK